MKYTNRLKTYALCIGLALSVVSCSNDDFEGTNGTDDQLVDMTFVSAGLESPQMQRILHHQTKLKPVPY